MTEERDRQVVQAVLKAVDLMEIISKERLIGISDLTRQSGLKKTTVARLLATLKRAGMVEQDHNSQRFYITIRVFEMGSRVLENLDIRRQAQPLIEDFVHKHGKSTLLSVLNRGEVVYIGKFEAPELFRIITSVGSRTPVYCSASGKAMLAFLDPERRRHILKEIPLKTFTAKTITDLAALEQDLAATRERGYSLDLGEHYPNLCSVAAPVFDSQGYVKAAISVPRIDATTSEDELAKLGQELVQLAGTVSRKIGWQGEKIHLWRE